MSTTVPVKEKYGLVRSWFFPIASEPTGQHPVYGPKVDLGSAVKDYLTINYSTAKAYGDDTTQLSLREFVDGQLQIETLLSDLEVDSKLYGSTYKDGALYDHVDDVPVSGAHACIQKLRTKSSGIVYRAIFYFYVTPSQNADNSDTKGANVTFMNNSITADVYADSAGNWRVRSDHKTQQAAETFIDGLARAVSGGAYALSVEYVGGDEDGSCTAQYITAGEKATVDFATKPSVLYDNAVDVTAQMAGNTYSIEPMNADHKLIAIWTA